MKRFEVIINTDALIHNLGIVRKLKPNSRVLSIIKSNAYGHGIGKVYSALKKSDGLGVTNILDAIYIRSIGFKKLIVLLNGFLDFHELALCDKYQLTPIVHQSSQYNLLAKYKPNSTLNLWLEIDSGMNRLGFNIAEITEVYTKIDKLPKINIDSLMMQWHSINELQSIKTSAQFIALQSLSSQYKSLISLYNSAGILKGDEPSDWVRPGVMLYGISPFNQHSAAELNLKPVMQLNSYIMHIRSCLAGDYVGYRASWTCPENMQIGIVPVGFADGYPHTAPSGTPIIVNGIKTQLIGIVGMDKLAVDLRPVAKPHINMPVQLWGNLLPLEEIASASNRVPSDLTCSIKYEG